MTTHPTRLRKALAFEEHIYRDDDDAPPVYSIAQTVMVAPAGVSADGQLFRRVLREHSVRQHWRLSPMLTAEELLVKIEASRRKAVAPMLHGLATVPILFHVTAAELGPTAAMNRNIQLRYTRTRDTVLKGPDYDAKDYPIRKDGVFNPHRRTWQPLNWDEFLPSAAEIFLADPDFLDLDALAAIGTSKTRLLVTPKTGRIRRRTTTYLPPPPPPPGFKADEDEDEPKPKPKRKERSATLREIPLAHRAEGMTYFERPLYDTTDIQFVQKARERHMPLFLFGVPGGGKSMLVEAALGRVLTIVGTADTEVSDFVGSYVQHPDGTYHWVDGVLLEAMENGGVLFVDEIGLIDPRVLSIVYSVMDGRNELTVTANPTRGIVVAGSQFYVCAATNPDAPGARISEALLSRFPLHLEVATDFSIAASMGVSETVVAAARNLEERRTALEVSWSPQLRELVTYQRTEEVFGTQIALAALVSSCPEADRTVVQDVLSRNVGKNIMPLALASKAAR